MPASDLVDKLTPITPLEYPTWVVLGWGLALAVAALAVITPAWRWTQLLVTTTHEMGHAIGGLMAGREFNSLSIHSDTSGVTYTSGKIRGLGRIVCSWSGYGAPGITGLLLTASVVAGVPNLLLLLVGVILLLCLIKARSLLTAGLLLGFSAASVALWWFTPTAVQASVLIAVASFMLIGGFRHVTIAWKDRKRDGGQADADALERLTHIPEVVWLVSFWVSTTLCAAAAAVAVVGLSYTLITA